VKPDKRRLRYIIDGHIRATLLQGNLLISPAVDRDSFVELTAERQRVRLNGFRVAATGARRPSEPRFPQSVSAHAGLPHAGIQLDASFVWWEFSGVQKLALAC
jgi:hypothetical protein